MKSIDGLVRGSACVNPPVTSFVYTSPTISPASLPSLSARGCVLLRFKILASAAPLIVAAAFARGSHRRRRRRTPPTASRLAVKFLP